jgi:hypothetical protein
MLTHLLPIRRLPIIALTLIMGAPIAACRKAAIVQPPSQATFLNQSSGAYFITDSIIEDTIPVGVTSVAGKDRIVSFAVSSATGATSGTEYTLIHDSVVILAGKAIGYIVIKGNYGFYKGTTRKDTLLFTLTDNGAGEVPPSDFNNSFTLVMRGPCVEGEDFDPAEFNGDYTNCIDLYPGLSPSKPYKVTITIISPPSPGQTSATLVIQDLGFGDFGASSVDTVSLDWSNPPNLVATVLSQPYFGGGLVMIASDTGRFSSCHQTFVLNYDVIYAGTDFGVFTTTIARQ